MSGVGMYVQETVIGKLKQHSVSPTNGQFKYVKDNNVGYICYSKINNILFITIVNCYVKSGYTTLCTLPQGCRPTAQIVFAIADNVAANYSYQRYCIINNNGEVIIKANANGEYIWATAATILNIPAQHSVSQHEDWVAARFKFGVDKITFWQNANGNFEIWFNTSKDNICLTFSRDMVGVYDANTRTGKSVHLSQHSVSRIIKTKQIDATTDPNGYLKTGLNAKQIPIGIGGLSDARYAFHTGNEADNGRTIRLMAWDGSVGRYSNKYVNVIVYYIEV